MKNLITKFMLVTGLLISAPSWALLITPGTSGFTTTDNSQPSASSIASLVGTSTVLTMLYKDNAGGKEEGAFAGSYKTVYDDENDPLNALISYTGGLAIDCTECYLTVKDGNQNPALYAFDISGWNGTELIDIQNFWPLQGAISNVAIWGGSSSVPAPATTALVGLGLLGLLVARRRSA